jgi:hypothetical protein
MNSIFCNVCLLHWTCMELGSICACKELVCIGHAWACCVHPTLASLGDFKVQLSLQLLSSTMTWTPFSHRTPQPSQTHISTAETCPLLLSLAVKLASGASPLISAATYYPHYVSLHPSPSLQFKLYAGSMPPRSPIVHVRQRWPLVPHLEDLAPIPRDDA